MTQELAFVITEAAIARINLLLKHEAANSKLRISIEGGGCSGFKYNYDFTTEFNDDDYLVKAQNIEVIIDKFSYDEFLKGSTLNYIQDLGGAYFEINNPNSSTRCGCGSSFAI